MDITFFDQGIETLPRDKLRLVQEEKLAAMLETVYGTNLFVTGKLDASGAAPRDVRTLEDLAGLPFTTKAELMAAQAEGLLSTNCTFPEAVYTRVHQTSGTTGPPLRVFDTVESWDWWGRCWGFVLAGAGLTARDRFFVPFSFGPFIGFWAALGGAKRIEALMVPGGGRTSAQRLQLMADMGVTAMACTPTYALRLVEVAREEGFDLSTIPMRITVHAGEPGASVPATKSRIEKEWGARCYDHAGASEVGAHSFECQAQPGGTHAIDSEFIIEVVDPASGRPVRSGDEGELVITNLGRVGFPVIRYRTGDVVCVNNSPCPCGRTFTRFDGGVIGRVDDMVVIRGVNVYPGAVENLLRRHAAVDEFRVTVSRQRELSTILIEIECREGADREGTERAVQKTFESSLGLRPEVNAVERHSLPRFELKAQRFFLA
ncbi:MAG: phenylacetate--CoA ligase [Acidimicrobiia bacterium]|nr:MAG: phenylacetate--CoA ligase [Acidimicrobiia bacterium]